MEASPEVAANMAMEKSNELEQSEEKKSKLEETIESIKETETTEQTDEAKKDRLEQIMAWKVVLFNDDIHSFKYVTEVLASSIPQLTREVAHTITVEAHNSGKATVICTWKSKAEFYCTAYAQVRNVDPLEP
ncbi:ATP-dependent Clp protease adaptor protein ClpS domain containing protein, putative [Babesia bigemina]|uniref:ATP-dependent Clp protease adaptor protein ClpS domain containing protein, putative n=1 Tax=Babesia bigemina TaxID=5866 RepID=A0A061DAK3_BABBI|nr:ATP-dependent Clp protease adaptor protein ClpS domain containing protein, putative [Babesia bigemina]CDR97721.1 ATP-dependent Clp protease adaptor protein ClpS domain containing protein, putative [Babesia bigemina]|eukprot:XP_012769907.1 ATP-dependent Clp protease adaptor protein ClpS domain containing protein, putative [Babesia bigemina]